MQTLTFSLLFEDHKNLWVYQKSFHSTIVLTDPQRASQIMYDIIIKEEKSDERKQKILSEVEKLFIGLAASLDSRSREQFNTRFTALKTFIFDLNATS